MLKVITTTERPTRTLRQLPGRIANDNRAGAEDTKMSTTTDAVSRWHWATTATPIAYTHKPGRQELWAGAVYLMVWSVLWIAVVVTVLSPLDVLFGGGR
jgi:hypothetical protein